MRFFYSVALWIFVVLHFVVHANGQTTKVCDQIPDSGKSLEQLIASLPVDNDLRLVWDRGHRGTGPHFAWMDEMSKCGIKQAVITFKFKWKYGVFQKFEKKKVSYYSGYFDYDTEVEDKAILEYLAKIGLADEIEQEAIRSGKNFVRILIEKAGQESASGEVSIVVLDDERLPPLNPAPKFN